MLERKADPMPSFSISGSAVSIAAIFGRWMARREQRQSLLELDDRLSGTSASPAADALREAERPFWRGMDGESLEGGLEARNRPALAVGSAALHRLQREGQRQPRLAVRQPEEAGAVRRLHHRKQPVGQQLVLVQPVELQPAAAAR